MINDSSIKKENQNNNILIKPNALNCNKPKKIFKGRIRIQKSQTKIAIAEVESFEYREIFILENCINNAIDGDVVLVELIDWAYLTTFQLENLPNYVIDMGIEIGKVKKVLKRLENQFFTGKFIINSKEKNKSKDFLMFKPNDTRIPLMIIFNNKKYANIFNNIESYTQHFFSVKIDKWTDVYKFPVAKIFKKIGLIPNNICPQRILMENKMILNDSNLESLADFSIKINVGDYKLTKTDLLNRVDLRNECIFTIDPVNAKDLDDAISCKLISEDLFELGVHIADVAHFVKPSSKLDGYIKLKSNSIYFNKTSIPLFPNKLSQNIFSFLPNKERLSFSVFWHIRSDGTILKNWFTKTVIKSKFQFNYYQVQDIINGTILTNEFLSRNNIKTNFNNDDMIKFSNTIKQLNIISKALRIKRMKSGSLFFNSIKFKFGWSKYNLLPLKCNLIETTEGHHLIEELMLLTNCEVAKKIYNMMPHNCLLRRHPFPNKYKLEKFSEISRNLGYHIDIYNSLSIQNSFNFIQTIEEYLVLKYQFQKCMRKAHFFSTSQIRSKDISKDWCHHFLLNFSYYTQFTSPIRRYSDIIIHRQLEYCLFDDQKSLFSYYANKKYIEKQAEYINYINQCTKNFQDQVTKLNLSYYFYNISKSNKVVRDAIVVEIEKDFLSILILPYGYIEKVFYSELKLASFKLINGKLFLLWKKASNLSNKVKAILELISFLKFKNFTINSEKFELIDSFVNNIQTLKIFDRIKVEIKVDILCHPPSIHYHLINPY